MNLTESSPQHPCTPRQAHAAERGRDRGHSRSVVASEEAGRQRRQQAGRQSYPMAQPPHRSRPVVVRGRIRDEFQCPITAQILRCVPCVCGGRGGGAWKLARWAGAYAPRARLWVYSPHSTNESTGTPSWPRTGTPTSAPPSPRGSRRTRPRPWCVFVLHEYALAHKAFIPSTLPLPHPLTNPTPRHPTPPCTNRRRRRSARRTWCRT